MQLRTHLRIRFGDPFGDPLWIYLGTRLEIHLGTSLGTNLGSILGPAREPSQQTVVRVSARKFDSWLGIRGPARILCVRTEENHLGQHEEKHWWEPLHLHWHKKSILDRHEWPERHEKKHLPFSDRSQPPEYRACLGYRTTNQICVPLGVAATGRKDAFTK